jgi:hypothetical protein
VIGTLEPEGVLAELASLVEHRNRLDKQIAAAALDAQYQGASVRRISDVLGVAPSTTLELLNRVAIAAGSGANDDVVIVAAASAYDLYLRFGVYACQVGRRFRNAQWLGFYRSKTIEPEIPRILHVEPYVKYEDDFVAELAKRGGQFDRRVADIVRELRDSGARPAGGTNEIVLLSPPHDSATIVLKNPIAHHGFAAWVRGQRYASSSALKRSRTTAELAALMRPTGTI